MQSRSSKRAAATAAALLLAGCNVGPNYKEPSVWSPASWFYSHGRPNAGLARASLPAPEPVNPDWWSAFQDPELTALEQRVAAANLDVQTATIRLAESRQQRRLTSADEFPQVQGSGSYERTRLSPRGEFGLIGAGGGGSSGTTNSAGGGSAAGIGGMVTPTTGADSMGANGVPSTLGGIGSSIRQPFNLWQYGFDASWELDLWGRVRRSIEAADASVDASAENRRNTLISVLAEVARDYIQLRDAQAQLAISRENQRTDQDSLNLTQDRARAGLTNELDVANAAAQLANVSATVAPLEQQEAQGINRLSFLLGETPGALAGELRAPQPVPPVPPSVPVGLPSELARRRPDVRMAEAQLHSATAQVGVAEANFYPSVVLSANLSIQALRFRDLGNWDSRTYTFGPNITIPIFEGGRLKAQLELNKETQLEAAVNFQRTVLNAFHEVDNALIAYDSEQHRRDQLSQSVEQNRRALDLARQRYVQGLSTFLDVLDAERQLLAAQQQLESSTATVSTNLVSLYLALGGGWETRFPVQQASAERKM